MAVDYLQSVELKLARAKDHLESLLTIERQLASGACTFRIEHDPQSNTSSVVLKLPPVDPRAGLSVGDCAHNLRSALDHIVYGMAERNAPTRSDEERRAGMFPICDTPHGFQRQVSRGRLNGVPADAVKSIEQVQPKNQRDSLWILNELDNFDKHRTITVVAALARDARLNVCIDGLPQGSFWTPIPTAPENQLAGWLFKIARNVALDHHRQRRRRPEIDLATAPEGSVGAAAGSRPPAR